MALCAPQVPSRRLLCQPAPQLTCLNLPSLTKVRSCHVTTAGDLLAVPQNNCKVQEKPEQIRLLSVRCFQSSSLTTASPSLSSKRMKLFLSCSLQVIDAVWFWELILISALSWIILSASENADSILTGFSYGECSCPNAYCWKGWIEKAYSLHAHTSFQPVYEFKHCMLQFSHFPQIIR